MTEGEVLAAIPRTGRPARPVEDLALVTAGRAGLAERFVRAWGARPGRLHVFDDGRDLSERGAEARLRRLAALRPGTRGATRADRARYAERLAARAGVDPALAGWALLGDPRLMTEVATRNAVFLDLLDRPHAHFDDDVLPFAPPGGSVEAGWRVVTGGDPTRIGFPGPGAAVPSGGEPVDLLAAQAAVLGRDAGSLLAEGAAPAPLDGATNATLTMLVTGETRVGTTMLGLLGDPGMGSPHYLLLRDGEARRAMLAGYPETLAGRRIARAVPRPTLGDGGLFMTYAVAFDPACAATLPFFPHGRNGDGAWAHAMARVAPRLLRAWLPLRVGHAPEPPRRWELVEELPRTGDWLLTDLLQACVRSRDFPRGEPPAARRAHLGHRLVELASLPPAAFDEFWRTRWIEGLAAYLRRLEAALDRHGGEPAAWAGHVRLALAGGRASLENPEGHLPPEVRAFLDADATRVFVQEQVRRYGELLLAWPAVVEAARALRAEGVRLTRALS